MYPGMCWQHTKSKRGLVLKKSKIPGSGKGLFTTKRYKPGDIITDYTGIVVTADDYAKDDTGYGLTLTKHKVLDSASTQDALGRYINDCRPKNKRKGHCRGPNVEFYWDDINDKSKVQVRALKHIRPGAELYVEYGEKGYWGNKAAKKTGPRDPSFAKKAAPEDRPVAKKTGPKAQEQKDPSGREEKKQPPPEPDNGSPSDQNQQHDEAPPQQKKRKLTLAEQWRQTELRWQRERAEKEARKYDNLDEGVNIYGVPDPNGKREKYPSDDEGPAPDEDQQHDEPVDLHDDTESTETDNDFDEREKKDNEMTLDEANEIVYNKYQAQPTDEDELEEYTEAMNVIMKWQDEDRKYKKKNADTIKQRKLEAKKKAREIHNLINPPARPPWLRQQEEKKQPPPEPNGKAEKPLSDDEMYIQKTQKIISKKVERDKEVKIDISNGSDLPPELQLAIDEEKLDEWREVVNKWQSETDEKTVADTAVFYIDLLQNDLTYWDEALEWNQNQTLRLDRIKQRIDPNNKDEAKLLVKADQLQEWVDKDTKLVKRHRKLRNKVLGTWMNVVDKSDDSRFDKYKIISPLTYTFDARKADDDDGSDTDDSVWEALAVPGLNNGYNPFQSTVQQAERDVLQMYENCISGAVSPERKEQVYSKRYHDIKEKFLDYWHSPSGGNHSKADRKLIATVITGKDLFVACDIVWDVVFRHRHPQQLSLEDTLRATEARLMTKVITYTDKAQNEMGTSVLAVDSLNFKTEHDMILKFNGKRFSGADAINTQGNVGLNGKTTYGLQMTAMDTFLLTLCHEMLHVIQNLAGEYKDGVKEGGHDSRFMSALDNVFGQTDRFSYFYAPNKGKFKWLPINIQ